MRWFHEKGLAIPTLFGFVLLVWVLNAGVMSALAETVPPADFPIRFPEGVVIDLGEHWMVPGMEITVERVTHTPPLGAELAGPAIRLDLSGVDLSQGLRVGLLAETSSHPAYLGLFALAEDGNWRKQSAVFHHGELWTTVYGSGIYAVFCRANDVKTVVNADVPYLHQVHDTMGDGFNGIWACGPTSAVMIAGFFGRLPEQAGFSSLGEFVYQGYALDNREFTRVVIDPDPLEDDMVGGIKSGSGAWGQIYFYDPQNEPGAVVRGACSFRAQQFFIAHGLRAEALWPTRAEQLVKTLDSGNILWASIVGHIIVIKGYIGYHHWPVEFIVHDPWGDPRKAEYHGDDNQYHRSERFVPGEGRDLVFSWDELAQYYRNQVSVRNALVVGELGDK